MLIFLSRMAMLMTGGSLTCGSGELVQDKAEHFAELRDEARKMMLADSKTQDLIRLIQIELELSDADDDPSRNTCRDVLRALAVSQNQTAVEHVRSVFENEPERRGMAAWALSQSTTRRPTDLQDWRYLVRSLTVVQGDEAVAVMSALKRFRLRANKPQWVRQAILIGLQLPPAQRPVAIALLHHWTGVPRTTAEPSGWTLAQYQEWFVDEYPEQPAAVLPVDSERQKWTLANLQSEIQALQPSVELVQAGELAFQKAGCQKCHRRGTLGEPFGPDLTSLGWRRQKSEILKAILFPSHDLDEEYPTVTVVLRDGRTMSGMMSAGAEGMLSLVSRTAVRQDFPRTEVEQIINQKISNMPDGTLEPLSLEEIRALFVFLTSVERVAKPHGDEFE